MSQWIRIQDSEGQDLLFDLDAAKRIDVLEHTPGTWHLRISDGFAGGSFLSGSSWATQAEAFAVAQSLISEIKDLT